MNPTQRESVWDYPRPPKIEPCKNNVRVEFNGHIIAKSGRAWRLLETSHPPTYYVPREDVRIEFLAESPHRTFCEFKGRALYWDLKVGDRISRNAAWSYPQPNSPYLPLRDHFAFYPTRVDDCFVDDERVLPQAGDFYGGWITANIVGPFKGRPGTRHW